jgi:hypothetical protein
MEGNVSDKCGVCGRTDGLNSTGTMCFRPSFTDEDAVAAACYKLGYNRSQEALAAARRECEAKAIALRNIVGVWKEIHDDAKRRRMWILGWETWLKVIAEGAALAAPATGESKPYPDPRCTCHARKSGKHAQSCELWNTTGDM